MLVKEEFVPETKSTGHSTNFAYDCGAQALIHLIFSSEKLNSCITVKMGVCEKTKFWNSLSSQCSYNNNMHMGQIWKTKQKQNKFVV